MWIASWQSEDLVRTRNSEFMLVGNGPYLVDRVDGGLHQIGVVSAVTGEWEADCADACMLCGFRASGCQ